jgi:hypothetical protein
MNHRFGFILLVLLLSVVGGLPVAGQEPTTPPHSLPPQEDTRSPDALPDDSFTYQGFLQSGGVPANGIYDFHFALWNDAVGGTQIGSTIAVNDVNVAEGVFMALLDFGDGAINGEAQWLLISVAPTGGTPTPLSPRQAIMPVPVALSLPGLYTQQNATTPNLIGGSAANTVASGAIASSIGGGGIGGAPNRIHDNYGTIGGGAGNIVGVPGSVSDQVLGTIGGGSSNEAMALGATVGGGSDNTASGSFSFVGGGQINSASSYFSVVAGGNSNLAPGAYAVVSGGQNNEASADWAVVSGGRDNWASEGASVIGGGTGNIVSTGGVTSTIAGGYQNIVAGAVGAIGGGERNNIVAAYGTIGGGGRNYVTAAYGTIGGGGGASSAEGNYVLDSYGTVGGGSSNEVGVADSDTLNQPYATVGGGLDNSAGGRYATIGGGWSNTAAPYATIAGGVDQNGSGTYAFVGGGSYNSASGNTTVVAGGNDNEAQGSYSIVGGGATNTAEANYSGILGGSGNLTTGDYSVVVGGQGGIAAHEGAFVWPGKPANEGETIASTASNQFVVRAPGGVWFGSGTDATMPEGAFLATDNGAFLTTGGTWANASDRTLKSGFATINPQQVLHQVAHMPIMAWHYLSEGETIQHLGPTAQDFYATFGLGSDDRHITTVDADGVALVAIQGLYEQNTELASRLAALEAGYPPTSLIPWLGMMGMAGIIIGWMTRGWTRKGGGA